MKCRPLNEETREKFANGYEKSMRYGELKKNITTKLNIFPVEMIRQKLISYQTILGLSFHLRHKRKLIQSVKLSTVHQSPVEAMIKLGQCVQIPISKLEDPLNLTLKITSGGSQLATQTHGASAMCFLDQLKLKKLMTSR